MSSISINGDDRHLPADKDWIAQRINGLRQDGVAVCVIVRVASPQATLTLASAACGTGGGGGRAPNAREQRIFDAWNKRGLGNGDVTAGDVIAFLNDLERLL